MDSAPILSAEAVSRGSLRGVNLAVKEGSLNLLFGAPGCGKNLFLRTLGLLDEPDEGDILFRGQPTRALPEPERAELRNLHFGFLFAEAYLLPSFSVVENVAMPFFRISGVDTGEARRRTRALLEFVGLGEREQASVQELSHAEQQRVSLARALVNRPEMVMVEAMDAASPGFEFCATLRRVAEEFGATVVGTASTDALAAAMDQSFEVARGGVHPLADAKGGA